MYLICTALSTDSASTFTRWKMYEPPTTKEEATISKLTNVDQPDKGGFVIFTDEREPQEEFYQLQNTICPSSLVMSNQYFVWADEEQSIIFVYDRETRVSTNFTHKLLSSPRCMSWTKNGILVVCPGLSTVLEFSLAGELLWSWVAHDAGFSETVLGSRSGPFNEPDIDHNSYRYHEYFSVFYPWIAKEYEDFVYVYSRKYKKMYKIDKNTNNLIDLFNFFDVARDIQINNTNIYLAGHLDGSIYSYNLLDYSLQGVSSLLPYNGSYSMSISKDCTFVSDLSNNFLYSFNKNGQKIYEIFMNSSYVIENTIILLEKDYDGVVQWLLDVK